MNSSYSSGLEFLPYFYSTRGVQKYHGERELKANFRVKHFQMHAQRLHHIYFSISYTDVSSYRSSFLFSILFSFSPCSPTSTPVDKPQTVWKVNDPDYNCLAVQGVIPHCCCSPMLTVTAVPSTLPSLCSLSPPGHSSHTEQPMSPLLCHSLVQGCTVSPHVSSSRTNGPKE